MDETREVTVTVAITRYDGKCESGESDTEECPFLNWLWCVQFGEKCPAKGGLAIPCPKCDAAWAKGKPAKTESQGDQLDMTSTKQQAFEIAMRAVQQRRAGDAVWACKDVSGIGIVEVDFDLLTGGCCARFTRQVEDAIRGHGDFTWRFASPTARAMQQAMDIAGGLRVDKPEPGDIGFGNNQQFYAGHTFRYMGMIEGVESIAENTSSHRGDPYDPGTKISPLSAVSAEFSGWYSVDASAPNLSKWGLLVRYDDLEIIGIIPVAGMHRDAGRVYYQPVKPGTFDRYIVPAQIEVGNVWGLAVSLADAKIAGQVYAGAIDDDRGRVWVDVATGDRKAVG